jgi:putative intracellular protease/amidase
MYAYYSAMVKSRTLVWSGVGLLAAVAGVGGAWLYSLPAGSATSHAPAISDREADAIRTALRPRKRPRPLIVGLLDGKQATTHWYYLDGLRKRHPSIHHVPNRRLVVDGGVATTTGISASMPMALTLIDAIAGHEKAEAIGRDIGVLQWDASHDSAAFQFTRPFALTAIRNSATFWNREQLGLELTPDVDEVSLALVADAWSRTYRSRALTWARTAAAQHSRHGVDIVPERVTDMWPAERALPPVGDRPPAQVLDATLHEISLRYRPHTAQFVAMQLEYPRRPE